MYSVHIRSATEPITAAEAMAYCRVDAENKEPAPGALTCALAGAGAGNVGNGTYRYVATFITAGGETQAGDISAAVTVVNRATNGKVALSNIQIGGSLVTSRRIYRTIAGGSTYLLLTTIANNSATTFTDDVADSGLGAGAPSVNTTSDTLINILIAAARSGAESRLNRFLVSQTVDLYLDCFPTWEIKLRPLQSVAAITYIDTGGLEQTLAASGYLVDAISEPARITPAYGKSWPTTRHQNNAVKIRFVAGYGAASAVPECIKNWMFIRIKQAYDNRDMTTSGSLAEFPRSVIDGLLDQERVWGL